MFVILNKKLIIIISLFLCLTLFFNFGTKVYADVVVLPIALKVFSTVLASMGILTYVSQNVEGGVLQFFENWKINKAIPNIALELFNTFSNSIKNNTKMRLGNIAASISSYFKTLEPEEVIPNPDFPAFQNVVATGTVSAYAILASIQNRFSKIDIGNNYYLQNRYSNDDGYLSFYLTYTMNGPKIANTEFILYDNIFSSHEYNYVNITYDYEISPTEGLSVCYDVINNSTNQSISGQFQKAFELPGLANLPVIEPPEVIDFPESKSIPIGLALPLEKLQNITGYVGQNVESFISDVADMPLENFIEDLQTVPKSYVDSIPQPVVTLDENEIITDIAIPEISQGEIDSIEQTSLLSSILATVNSIKDLFAPTDVEELNFDPIKNIAITTKFPFSLPWDLKNSINLLIAPSEAPNWDFPILSENINIDMSEFESLALIARSFLSIIFVISLIILTRQFVGGA